MLLLEPKLYIKKYFEDIINQLDIATLQFEIEKSKETEENTEILPEIDQNDIEIWRQQILKQLEKSEHEILQKITLDFELDNDLKIEIENYIKTCEESFNKERDNLNYKE